jgi:hypothetical protein
METGVSGQNVGTLSLKIDFMGGAIDAHKAVITTHSFEGGRQCSSYFIMVQHAIDEMTILVLQRKHSIGCVVLPHSTERQNRISYFLLIDEQTKEHLQVDNALDPLLVPP